MTIQASTLPAALMVLLLSAFPAQAQANAIQTQETQFDGVVAELYECKRKKGVLTIKMRFRNESDTPVFLRIDTDHGKYGNDKYYLIAEDKKYSLLKDEKGQAIAPRAIYRKNLKKGQTYSWWAKFPAPPVEVAMIDSLIMPGVLPFEDIPITDR